MNTFGGEEDRVLAPGKNNEYTRRVVSCGGVVLRECPVGEWGNFCRPRQLGIENDLMDTSAIHPLNITQLVATTPGPSLHILDYDMTKHSA